MPAAVGQWIGDSLGANMAQLIKLLKVDTGEIYIEIDICHSYTIS